jgi:hypothetical protein
MLGDDHGENYFSDYDVVSTLVSSSRCLQDAWLLMFLWTDAHKPLTQTRGHAVTSTYMRKMGSFRHIRPSKVIGIPCSWLNLRIITSKNLMGTLANYIEVAY